MKTASEFKEWQGPGLGQKTVRIEEGDSCLKVTVRSESGHEVTSEVSLLVEAWPLVATVFATIGTGHLATTISVDVSAAIALRDFFAKFVSDEAKTRESERWPWRRGDD